MAEQSEFHARKVDKLGYTDDLGYTEEPVDSTHVCLIYDRDEQRWETLTRYLAAGLRQGEIVRYFADSTPAQEVRARLAGLGVDVAEAEDTGSFTIVDAVPAYCPQGVFDPDSMISRVSDGYAVASRRGYTGTRSTGEMTWALRGLPGSELFWDYELRLNAISTPYRHSGMCQYDARAFDGAAMFRVLQVHPYLVAGGQIVRNPCYGRPDAG